MTPLIRLTPEALTALAAANGLTVDVDAEESIASVKVAGVLHWALIPAAIDGPYDWSGAA